MSAQIIQLKSNVAYRYARLMAARYEPQDRAEVVSDYMNVASGLVTRGMDRQEVQHLIELRRARLIRELAELDTI